MRWFIKISLVDTTEMQEILVTRRVSGIRLKNAGVSREMRETWQVWETSKPLSGKYRHRKTAYLAVYVVQLLCNEKFMNIILCEL